MWLLHLSDRVSCDELYGSGYATISKEFDRRSSLFLPYTFFGKKRKKLVCDDMSFWSSCREHTCSRCMCSRCSHLNQESKMSQIGFHATHISSSHSFQSTNTKRLPKAQTPNGCRSYHIIASSLWPNKATMGLKEMVRMCGFDMP